jgi:hypothetical protein
MFSMYKKGIKNVYPEKQPIILSDLAKRIRNNPACEKINQIRQMRENGDQAYKEIKRTLEYITPNCVVKKRILKDDSEYNTNFINFSGYIYFDFDITDAVQYKQEFIQKYKHVVSLVCISSGGGGISVLVKVNTDLAKDNFNSVWEFIAFEVFKGESIDTKTKDIGRAMFISSDPDLFVDYENELIINPSDLQKYKSTNSIKKSTYQRISPPESGNTPTCTFPFQLLHYEEIKKVILSTPYDSKNSVIDYQPIDFLEIKFPKQISDGAKHKFYSSCIHRLVYLNPDIDPNYLYSFIFYTNICIADPPMESRSLKRLFVYVYSQTQQEDYVFNNDKIKNFHLNKGISHSKEDKITIMNRCNGKVRSNKSIIKILEAKAELRALNQKITQNKVSEISGLGIQTVKKYYWLEDICDISSMVNDINSQYSTNSGLPIDYNAGFTSTSTDGLFDDYIIDYKNTDGMKPIDCSPLFKNME